MALLSGPMVLWRSSRTVMLKLRLLSQKREQKKKRIPGELAEYKSVIIANMG